VKFCSRCSFRQQEKSTTGGIGPQLHPSDESNGTFHDFTGDTNGSRIDYIFVTTDVDVTAAEIVHDNTDGRYPSDHFPIKATLTLP
jgi:endonuclease/exonuclease/phosphatase family metal-dependent hydrolase